LTKVLIVLKSFKLGIIQNTPFEALLPLFQYLQKKEETTIIYAI